MGTGASLASEEDVRELEATSNFSTKEIPKLMKRFARYDPDGRNGGITLKQFLDIPEISTNPIMPKVASVHLDSRSRKITYRSFINMLSRLSPRNSLDDRKEFAFQVLDTDGNGQLSYHELFSLFRMVTGPVLTDDQVVELIAGILSRSNLQQDSKVSFQEFTNIVSDDEIEQLFTVELQLP